MLVFVLYCTYNLELLEILGTYVRLICSIVEHRNNYLIGSIYRVYRDTESLETTESLESRIQKPEKN